MSFSGFHSIRFKVKMCPSIGCIGRISNLSRKVKLNLGKRVKRTPIVGVISLLEGTLSCSCQNLNLKTLHSLVSS